MRASCVRHACAVRASCVRRACVRRACVVCAPRVRRACVVRACVVHDFVRASRACVGTYGNLWELHAWELMGTYGNFVRGNLWELMGTYGNLWELRAWDLRAWELMGTPCVAARRFYTAVLRCIAFFGCGFTVCGGFLVTFLR